MRKALISWAGIAMTCVSLSTTPIVSAQVSRYLYTWGVTGDGPGQFRSPQEVEVDFQGNVYVADLNGIQKFSSDGTYLTRFGSTTVALAVDAAGYVYAGYYSTVQIFTSDGQPVTQWEKPGSGPGQFTYVSSLSIDDGGNVYLVDGGDGRLEKLDHEGNFVWSWRDTTKNLPDCACWNDGTVYVIAGSDLCKLDEDGILLSRVFGHAISTTGVTVDSYGTIYEASATAGLMVLGPDGSWGYLTNEFGVSGVAVGESGIVYVTQAYEDRVLVFARPTVPVKRLTWGQLKHKY